MEDKLNHKETNMQKVRRFLSVSSKRVLSLFLSDTLGLEKHYNFVRKALQTALTKHTLVVLQLADEKGAPKETIYGYVRSFSAANDSFVFTVQGTNELKMIKVPVVKKISLSPAKTPVPAANKLTTFRK